MATMGVKGLKLSVTTASRHYCPCSRYYVNSKPLYCAAHVCVGVIWRNPWRVHTAPNCKNFTRFYLILIALLSA